MPHPRAARVQALTQQELEAKAAELGIDLLHAEAPQPPLPAAAEAPHDEPQDDAPGPPPEEGPLVAAAQVRRLYRLVRGRDLSEELDTANINAGVEQRENAIRTLDVIRRGLAALQRISGEIQEADSKNRGLAARSVKLAQLRGQFVDTLKRRLATLDAELLAMLLAVPAVEQAERAAAGFYHAEFTVQFFEYAGAGPPRRAGSLKLRGWARLTSELVIATRAIKTNSPVVMGPTTWPVAAAFGWGETHNNWLSQHSEVTVDVFEEVPEDAHEAGTWNAADVKLTRHGRVQPTLGCPAGRFVKAGSDISRPEFYRDDSCMLSLFLETWAGRLQTRRSDLTLEALYMMATGEPLVEGQPAGVSLREAEKWLAHWRLSGRAINARGELVWRYDPVSTSKKIAGGAVWRLLVHDEHVWLCDQEVKEFDREITANDSSRAQPSIPTAADISVTLSSRWRRPPKPTGVPPTFVQSSADVLSVGEDVAAVVTNGSVEELFVALWEAGHEPGSVHLDKGTVESFTVRVGDGGTQVVRVGPAISVEVRDDQRVTEALTSRSQVVFEEHLARGRAAFQPIDGLSTYSESLATAFRTYTRGPRVGLIGGQVTRPLGCIEFDVSRAYTSFLAEIKHVPVFSVFDEVRPYGGDDIVPQAFYLVRVETLDGVLFPLRYDFVPGETVAYARKHGIALELLGVARPCRLVETNGRAILHDLYADEECSDPARKNIANIIYGLGNKGRNRKQVASCFRDEAEARASGGYLKQLGPGFISVKQGVKDLSEGYLPVGRLVLDAMRRRLHATVLALGGDAIGVKTDAVFVHAEHGERATAALLAAGFHFGSGRSGWDVVGTIRVTTKPLPELKQLPLDKNTPLAVRVQPAPVCDRIYLRDEGATLRDSWAEVDALMPSRPRASTLADAATYGDDMLALANDMLADLDAGAAEVLGPIALEAAVPGAGKTYLAKSWVERTGQKDTTLFVPPWNALVTQLVREGFRAITVHELVGRLAVETEEGHSFKKAYNLAGVTHVHFEEVYLLPVNQVGWIRDFMRKNPRITYSMAGDPGQLAPVRQDLCVDSDLWYEQAFASMFPRRICLQVSKRVADEADRARMLTLCNELRSEARPVAAILRDAGLRVVHFDSLTEADASYPHVAAMRSTMARVDHWAHALIGDSFADEYVVGQELLGVDGVRCRGGRIASNETYTVSAVDDDAGLTLSAPDGSHRIVTMAAAKRYLKRPYCRTGHSTQGLSLGDRIYIHDWQSDMATHRWIRTAVSRCGTLDIVLVDGSEGIRHSWHSSEARIEVHRVSDLGKGYTWEHDDYVTTKWVGETLRRQRYSCWACSEPLDLDWSIDRVANELPHIRGNCAISCRSCQSASAHRE